MVYYINRRNYPYNEKHFLKGLLIKITSAVSATVLACSVFTTDAHAAAYNITYSETGTANTEVSWPDAPEVNSSSCILIDADTGSILFERNSHENVILPAQPKFLPVFLPLRTAIWMM